MWDWIDCGVLKMGSVRAAYLADGVHVIYTQAHHGRLRRRADSADAIRAAVEKVFGLRLAPLDFERWAPTENAGEVAQVVAVAA